jgi:hypothetical protein
LRIFEKRSPEGGQAEFTLIFRGQAGFRAAPASSFNKLTRKETQPCSVFLVLIFATIEAGAARNRNES